MSTKFEVIDNFLDHNDFMPLYDLLTSEAFPWFFNRYSVEESEKAKDVYDYQLIHVFYWLVDGVLETNSDYSYILKPILHKLNCLNIIRAKANLRTIDQKEKHKHYYHQDIYYPTWNIPTTVAIFYVNTNNGCTIFEDSQEKVGCVANRLVRFDSRLRHAAVGSTDSKTRIVINFNYIESQNG